MKSMETAQSVTDDAERRRAFLFLKARRMAEDIVQNWAFFSLKAQIELALERQTRDAWNTAVDAAAAMAASVRADPTSDWPEVIEETARAVSRNLQTLRIPTDDPVDVDPIRREILQRAEITAGLLMGNLKARHATMRVIAGVATVACVMAIAWKVLG
jgi:hypothetical protein